MTTSQPTDKSHFILPDLGEGVHEAELIRWHVKPGETVTEHQTLAEMETDKALVEVPSPWGGVIASLEGAEGDIITVGSVLVRYAVEGADLGTAPPAPDTLSDDAGTVVGSVEATVSVPDSFLQNEPATASTGKVLATPAVRRLARELGITLDDIHGTGRGGRVTASDIETHAGDAPLVASPAISTGGEDDVRAIATPVALPLEGVAERIPFRGIRRRTAQALHHSVQTAVHFTVVDEVVVTELDRKRRGFAELLGRPLSLLPFVMAATCKALRSHPALNATVDDFMNEIHVMSEINVGCAVDTEHGLMVPVIHDAAALSVVQMADAVVEVATGCRDRTIERDRFVGGTFTISNVGSHGGAFATPIINYPEVAILAVGRAREQVLTRDGAFFAGLVLPLSLSCDHRVVDGAAGARFLETLMGLLEAPDEFLPQV